MTYARLNKIESQLDDLERAYNVNIEPDIYIDGLCFKLNHPKAIKYDPYSNSEVGTYEKFHNDRSTVRLMKGGFGSAKSTSCCLEPVLQLYNMPPMKDGIRRARGVIIRNTMGELESTTLKTWAKWFHNEEYGIYLGKPHIKKKPNLIYSYDYFDNKGRCQLELFCIGLDREDQKKKLESLELTFGIIDEAQHVPRGVLTHLVGRIGRYPDPCEMEEDYFAYVICATNPPSNSHWIYEDFDGRNKIKGNRIFHQPPGLIKDANNNWVDNPKADNFKHLKKYYYSNMAQANGFDEQYIKVICNGGYGLTRKGRPVYSAYNDGLHSVEIVEIDPHLPLIIGIDGGSTPAALVEQFSNEGQLRAIKEFTTNFSSAQTLKENHVKPWVQKVLSEGQKVLLVLDPSMKKSNENIEISAAEVWEDELWEVVLAKSNHIDTRLEAQKFYLNSMVGEPAKPAFILSRRYCPVLREAMISDYCYIEVKGKNEGTYKDIPDKVHPHSDIADCGQYGALECRGEGIRIYDEQITSEEWESYRISNYQTGRSKFSGY